MSSRFISHPRSLPGAITLALILAALTTYGCQDQVHTETPVDVDRQLVTVEDVQLESADLRGLDAIFAKIATDAPGFAGIHYDGDALVLMLTDPSQEAAATQSLRSYHDGHYLSQGVEGERDVRVQEVDFTFMELARWRKAAYRALGMNDVDWILGDVDEVENAVTIGVQTLSAADRVRDILQDIGIPDEAVRVEVREPPRPMSHTLDDKVRPVRGGLALNQTSGGETHPDSTGSTHGFVAEFSDGTDGFFLSSHQTYEKFAVDSTSSVGTPKQFGQDEIGLWIGDEYDDTEIISCPSGISDPQGCVRGDVAFVRYVNLSSSDYGYNVARLEGDGTYGTRDIKHAAPNWPVGDDAVGSPAVAGQELSKTGQTTGRTWGLVDETCSDVSQDSLYSGVQVDEPTQLCEYKVVADPSVDSPVPMIGNGDSGAPVFSFVGFTGEVSIHGIFWGSDDGPDSGDTKDDAFWYSDIDGIVDEFGSITTH